jgi:hypothetical protein
VICGTARGMLSVELVGGMLSVKLGEVADGWLWHNVRIVVCRRWCLTALVNLW